METPPSKEHADDSVDNAIEPLSVGLGAELSPRHNEIIAALKDALIHPPTDSDVLKQLWIEYAEHFETLAEATDDQERYTKIQIAAILHKAFIFRDTGNELRYLEELDKADMYLGNEGLDTLSAVISTQIEVRTRQLEESPERLILELRGIISDANRAFLWDLWADEQDYEDLENHAFEMLLEEGEDSQSVLVELGILED